MILDGHRGPVVPLDPAGKNDLVRIRDERTPKDADLPRTEPERSREELARFIERTAMTPPIDKAALHRVPAFVDLGDGHEAITRPDKNTGSDVFAPIVREQPTPNERRPAKLREEDIDTALISPLAAERNAPTKTLRADAARERPASGAPVRELSRHEIATARERDLVECVYDTQRAFLTLQQQEPQRAEHITSVNAALRMSGVFDRDQALAQHARERMALNDATDIQRKSREDRVFALALLARELDDKYREQTRALKEQLLDDVRALPADKRDRVFEDFESFAQSEPANDSNHCRRQLHKALREEQVLHKAYVYALALDKKSDPKRVEADATTLLKDLSAPRSDD